MIKKLKKTLAITTMLVMLLTQGLTVYAQEIPTAPTPPPAPENTVAEPTPPPAPELSTTANPTPPADPTPPPAPTLSGASASPTPLPNALDQLPASSGDNDDDDDNGSTSLNSPSPSPSSLPSGNQTGGVDTSGQSGTTAIDTGSAVNSAAIITNANTNTTTMLPAGSGSASVVNSGNGSGSENTGSASVINNNTDILNNSATVANLLDQGTVTGSNNASKNLGDTSIDTGDANTTGTVVNSINTNMDGVAVAEFNIVDDQQGDLVLDFAAGCISNCGLGSQSVANTGNGTGSDNTASVDTTTNDATFMNNDATVGNELILSADSGANTADSNTDGNTSIGTGDANVSANALTFANNNLDGNVVYTTVNIFGDMVGDIIMPDDYAQFATCVSGCGGEVAVSNTGNGSGSTNTGTSNTTLNDTTYQFNTADIENVLDMSATTGGNSASDNTGGNTTVATGDTNIDANVVNVANSNVDGSNWFLVLVNEAGQWVGKIFGSPDGTNMAGSPGTEFTVDENGAVTITNSGNGSDSTNTGTVNNSQNNTTSQSNNASITNNLTLSANTGGNSASKNTGGNTTINTGDANIVANIVNFVNNNITGGGKIYLTVINVFGSWVGDFVGPGYKKDQTSQQQASSDQQNVSAQGGQQTANNSSYSSGGTKITTTLNSSDDEDETSFSIPAQFTNYFTGSNSSGVGGDSEVKVAGFVEAVTGGGPKASVLGAQATANKIKINLAWLLVIIPSFAIMWYGVARFKKLRGERLIR